METTSFGAAASLLFVGVPTLFLIGLFVSTSDGEKVLLISQYNLLNKIRLNCKTSFVKVNGEIGAEALVELVVVKRKNDSIKVVRELPVEIKKIFLLLEEGPEI